MDPWAVPEQTLTRQAQCVGPCPLNRIVPLTQFGQKEIQIKQTKVGEQASSLNFCIVNNLALDIYCFA